MHAEHFVATHAQNTTFERGLGIAAATKGRIVAQVIRAAAGAEFSSQANLHRTQFQWVYLLKDWIEFEYECQGVVPPEAGPCVYQPPGIRHREPGHSDDVEMLEVVTPGNFATELVDTAQG